MKKEINNIPKWKYKNFDLDGYKQLPDEPFGFIYKITLSNGKSYLGKKNFFTERKVKLGKKELALITDKRLKKYKIVKKESDWQTYIGSNKELKEDVAKGVSVVSRDILFIARDTKQLTYLETRELFKEGVLEREGFYNDNILGKFFRKDV